MDQRDRAAIEGLFERIARVAQRSGPRDRGAEALHQLPDRRPARGAVLHGADDHRPGAGPERGAGAHRGAGATAARRRASEGLLGGLFGSRETDRRTRYADARREMRHGAPGRAAVFWPEPHKRRWAWQVASCSATCSPTGCLPIMRPRRNTTRAPIFPTARTTSAMSKWRTPVASAISTWRFLTRRPGRAKPSAPSVGSR